MQAVKLGILLMLISANRNMQRPASKNAVVRIDDLLRRQIANAECMCMQTMNRATFLENSLAEVRLDCVLNITLIFDHVRKYFKMKNFSILSENLSLISCPNVISTSVINRILVYQSFRQVYLCSNFDGLNINNNNLTMHIQTLDVESHK